MSGIYIPKMEMPKNCYECPIAQGYTKPAYCGLNGSIPKLWEEFDDALEKEIKPDFCPLIAVPDHGRLIDADALEVRKHEKEAYNTVVALYKQKKFNANFEYYRGYSDGLVTASGLVRFAPTIIPAEEGKT